jgi:hypothetical protein
MLKNRIIQIQIKKLRLGKARSEIVAAAAFALLSARSPFILPGFLAIQF